MRPISLFLPLGLLAFGCDGDADASSKTAVEQTTAVEVPPAEAPSNDEKAAPAKPTPKVETKTYVAELSSSADATLSVGDKAKLLVTIRPQNGWHMNHEFPTSVTLAESEAMAPEKSRVEKKDAKRFDDDGADFELPVSVEKGGTHDALADLSFAVCTEQTCLPEKIKLALSLEVADKGSAPKAAEQSP